MGKVTICGDLHGEFYHLNKLINKQNPEYLIALGDFGFWPHQTSWVEGLIKAHDTKVLWLDGNHECIAKGSDVLTKDGWKDIEFITNEDLIAQFEINTGEISYSKPINYIKKYAKDIISIESFHTKQMVTLGHNIIINNNKIKASEIIQKQINENDFRLTGFCNNKYNISDELLRLLVWVVCDSTIVDNSIYKPNSKKIRIQFKLSRQDKIVRLTKLLNNINFPFTIKECKKGKFNKLQPFYIRIYGDYSRKIYEMLNSKKCFPNFFRELSIEQKHIVLSELEFTDGHRCSNNRITFSTINKSDADIIQELCITSNKICTIKQSKQHINAFGKKNIYKISISDIIKNYKVNSKIINYNDDVFCFTMPLGTLITRYDGKVAFTGNCFASLNARTTDELLPNVIYMPRGTVKVINDLRCLFLGGAESIDKKYRTPGFDWFPEELITEKDYETSVNNIKNFDGIDIVFSHTCPMEFGVLNNRYDKYDDPSRIWLSMILKEFQPKRWYFGHWHVWNKGFNKGCFWECLDYPQHNGRWWTYL